MLSQKYRFHSRGGVRYTYQKGKSVRSSLISLIYAKNTRNHRRFAVVVSKKVLKSAVGRNAIRRRVYEAIRLEMDHFPQPTDYIFVVYQKTILDIPFLELRRDVRELLTRTQQTTSHQKPNHRQ